MLWPVSDVYLLPGVPMGPSCDLTWLAILTLENIKAVQLANFSNATVHV